MIFLLFELQRFVAIGAKSSDEVQWTCRYVALRNAQENGGTKAALRKLSHSTCERSQVGPATKVISGTFRGWPRGIGLAQMTAPVFCVLLCLVKSEVAIMDGMLLQSVEGIGETPFVGSGGEIWELLQAEKEEVSRDILAGWPLTQDDAVQTGEDEPSAESDRAVEWRHRESLEDRLRAINDAQDRLMDGAYGICEECSGHISAKRLLADPAAALCVVCQQMIEQESARGLFAHTL
jgi:RNA polymerase-binding transcription factor DksA